MTEYPPPQGDPVVSVPALQHNDQAEQSIPPETALQPTAGPYQSGFENDTPALNTWKTSVGFSALGYFASYFCILTAALIAAPIAMGVTFALGLSSDSKLYVTLGSVLAFVIWLGTSIFYAAKIYPSYFGAKPIFKSNSLISLLNFMFGSLIFGSLWNSCLTRRKKGASHIVYIVLVAILLAFLPATIAQSASTYQEQSMRASFDTSISPVPMNSLDIAEGSKTYIDNETGATFQVPSVWVEEPYLDTNDFIDIQFVNDKETEEYVLAYGSYDAWSNVDSSYLYRSSGKAQPESMNSRLYFKSDFAQLVDIPTSELESVIYGAHAFYKYTPTEYNVPGESVTMLFYLDNGYLYRVVFWDYGQNIDALASFAASLTFQSDH